MTAPPLDGGRACRLYAWLLRLYPGEFRRAYGPELIRLFVDLRAEPRHAGARGALRLWSDICRDMLATVLRQRARQAIAAGQARAQRRRLARRQPASVRRSAMETLVQDVRYAHSWAPSRSSPSCWPGSESTASSRRDPRVADLMVGDSAAQIRLEALSATSERLEEEFGSWQTPWGEINRFQRVSADIVQQFDDDQPSIPVAMGSGGWGALASYGSRQYPGTVRWYGTGGNSFVAAVEFGDRLRAKAITAGGQSGDPNSPHFNDQGAPFSAGKLRDVWFYREDVDQHAEREYHPGQ